eukprot:6305606-Prymnesium_polylepis.1
MVSLGGYICTIFGWPAGVPPKVAYSSSGFRSNESLVYGTSWLRGRSIPVALKSANWSRFHPML